MKWRKRTAAALRWLARAFEPGHYAVVAVAENDDPAPIEAFMSPAAVARALNFHIERPGARRGSLVLELEELLQAAAAVAHGLTPGDRLRVSILRGRRRSWPSLVRR